MVSNRCPCSRSTFSEPNRVSLHALSQQFPLRLIEGVIPHCFSTLLKSSLTTQYTVKHYIDDHLLPRWGASAALDIQPLEIEQWLDSLQFSNPTKNKIRRIMSIVYTRAQKYGHIPRNDSSNPVRWVE